MQNIDPPTIRWYRTTLDKGTLQALARRSNLRGAFYTIFHLGLILICMVGAVASQLAQAWLAMFVFSLGYGVVMRFSSNALHEFAHGTVFSLPGLNLAIGGVFGFFSMINLRYFWVSHREHHKYTLHSPYDREVEEPELHDIRQFLIHGFVSFDLRQSLNPILEMWRLALGKCVGEWQTYLFQRASERELEDVKAFSRKVLMMHGLIGVLALALGVWIIPVLLLLGRQAGGLPFMLCNNTQHAGLPDGVNDFRLCCRTFTLSAPLSWLYWNMNYHIEHHMYPKVPCYQLPSLHLAIRHELPPVAHGLWPVWREIIEAVKHQRRDAAYRLSPTLPNSPASPAIDAAESPANKVVAS